MNKEILRIAALTLNDTITILIKCKAVIQKEVEKPTEESFSGYIELFKNFQSELKSEINLSFFNLLIPFICFSLSIAKGDSK